MRPIALCLFTCFAAEVATADVVVTFDEGAPTDRFTILNDGGCALTNTEVLVDLGPSAAGLIFDVTGTGAGVQVYQPLRFVSGENALSELPQLRDGDTAVTLQVARLDPGAAIVFTTDVDDTKGQRATMISATEIEGARVFLPETGAEAQFERNAQARVPHDACSV